MSKVYSQQLVLGHAVGTIVVTIPVDERWVIRQITTFYPNGPLAGFTQLVDNGSSATFWWEAATGIVGGEFHETHDLRIVLIEGRSFTLECTGSPDVGLYGYALTLP